MKFLIGKKKQMTQVFTPKGERVSVTVIEAGPCTVTQIRTADARGRNSAQLGFGTRRKLTKALAGHLKGLGAFRYLREFSLENGDAVTRGDVLDVNVFTIGDKITVSGTSKGKGFQGVVRRHGFHGAPKTHGTKDQLRMPGSIGSTGPQRVFKGTRMGGRMGGDTVTVTGLEVIAIDPATHSLSVKGAIPGPRGGVLEVYAKGALVVQKQTEPTPVVEEVKQSEAVSA